MSIARAFHTGAIRASIRPTFTQPITKFVRFESSKKVYPGGGPTTDPAALDAVVQERLQLRKDWVAPVLSYEDLKPRTVHPSPNAYLIDVREPNEVLQGSIPSSVNIPLSTITPDLVLPEDQFKEKYGFEKPGKEQEIIFYCRSGKRSASACDIARRQGYSNLQNYQGSWLEWVAREGTPAAPKND